MQWGRVKETEVFLRTINWILFNILGEIQTKNGIPFRLFLHLDCTSLNKAPRWHMPSKSHSQWIWYMTAHSPIEIVTGT